MCTLTGHEGEINSVAFSVDGKRVVSGSCDHLVKIWNSETGAEVSSFVGVCSRKRGKSVFKGGSRIHRQRII